MQDTTTYEDIATLTAAELTSVVGGISLGSGMAAGRGGVESAERQVYRGGNVTYGERSRGGDTGGQTASPGGGGGTASPGGRPGRAGLPGSFLGR